MWRNAAGPARLRTCPLSDLVRCPPKRARSSPRSFLQDVALSSKPRQGSDDDNDERQEEFQTTQDAAGTQPGESPGPTRTTGFGGTTTSNDGVNNHQNKPDEFDPIPAPLTADVTSANPLEVDVFDSIRSPYSYLVINRLAYLQSNYNCTVTMRVIFPGAIRMPDVAGGAVDDEGNQVMQQPANKTHYKQGGRWYKWADCVWDCYRVAQFQGIPWKFANPDPIDQNHYPFLGLNYGQVPTIENQTWISWMVRLANAAQLAGKSMEFLLFTGPLIWGGESDFWPADIPAAWNKLQTEMNYDENDCGYPEEPRQVRRMLAGKSAVANSVGSRRGAQHVLPRRAVLRSGSIRPSLLASTAERADDA